MPTHPLFALDEIEAGTARKVVIGDREIALVRIDDDVYAIGDTCSHDDVSLAEGFVEADDCMIECFRHGALFNLKTGEPESLPAVRPVPVYDVSVVDGQVVLTIDEPEDDA
ncbi:MAG: non-heme iron oxygenase ferredoxin subunit [Acidimicrobiales bacterium]|nr:non-heme iron oxygenase ferredoxin subunit [Acidimicrobiales bacterium]